MQPQPGKSVELTFSQKYDKEHAEIYFQRHRQGLARRLSNWREVQLARAALRLAGHPNSVLDLPCGAGRFWPMLMEKSNRIVIGADNSADMLKVAQAAYPDFCQGKISCLQTSAFDIDLPDSAVDCILCIRLLHHIGEAEHRQQLLREFHRVTRDTLIISLWVDGNYKAWRRRRLEAQRRRAGEPDPKNRFVISRKQIENEFTAADFDIIRHYDLIPGYQMWRTYVLRKR